MRTHRIDVRLSSSEKALIERATKITGETLGEFVRRSALSSAHEVLALRTHFVLPEAQWLDFCERLDAPARVSSEYQSDERRTEPFLIGVFMTNLATNKPSFPNFSASGTYSRTYSGESCISSLPCQA